MMMEYFYSSNYATNDQAPDFSLPFHTKVFCLAVTLSIPGLEELAVAKYKQNLSSYVTDLGVYFASVKDIYALTTSEIPELRNAVVEAAISEMQNLLSGPEKKRLWNMMLKCFAKNVDQNLMARGTKSPRCVGVVERTGRWISTRLCILCWVVFLSRASLWHWLSFMLE